MSICTQRITHVLAVSALALGLAACGPNEGQTAGQKLDNAIDRTEQAAADAKAEADRAAASAGQRIDQAVDATRDAAADAEAAARNAASDAAQIAGEAGVTARVNSALIADPELSALKIDVDTQGTVVTLSGEAPNQTAKDRASEIARAVDGVTSVNNLLTVR